MTDFGITNDAALDAAAGYLHDAVFERNGIQYDATGGTLTIHLWREVLDEGKSERIFLFFYRWRFPHRKCILQFHGIETFQLKITDNLDHYQIRDMHFNREKGELRILAAC